MQRDKLSDITVNISIAEITQSAEFGCPLLAFPNVVSGNENYYLECEGYDDAMSQYTDIVFSGVTTVGESTNAEATWTGETIENITYSNSGTGTITAKTDYLSCSQESAIKFVSSETRNNLTLKAEVSLVSDDGEVSTEYDNALVRVMKNSEVVSSVSITKDDGFVTISLELGSVETTDEFEIVYTRGVFIRNLMAVELSEEVTNALSTFYTQENAPAEAALFLYTDTGVTDSDLAALFEQDWRAMICCGEYNDFCLRAAAYAQKSDDRLVYILDTDGTVYSNFAGIGRAVVFYNNEDSAESGSQTIVAVAAEAAGKDVGGFTYKNLALTDVPTANITASELKAYHNNNVNSYVSKHGTGVTSEGKTMDGTYIDIIDAKDWLVLQIEYRLQQLLINNDKIPYDDAGIAMLESVVVDVLKDAYNNGMIAESEDGGGSYSVSFAKRSETSASDRAVRQYMEGSFSFDLAGAVHTVTINGVINI